MAAAVCKYWRSGNCIRSPCRFLHHETASPRNGGDGKHHLTNKAASVWRRNPTITSPYSSPNPETSFSSKKTTTMKNPTLVPASNYSSPKPATSFSSKKTTTMKNPTLFPASKPTNPTAASSSSSSSLSTATNRSTNSSATDSSSTTKSSISNVICNNFLTGRSCPFGHRCRYLHRYFVSRDESFSLLTTLTTQTAAAGAPLTITGIAIPSGSHKLYSGCKDGSVRAWDCQTGQCLGALNLGGGEVGCMISEGPWLFVGIPNAVKAWNTANATTDDPITLTCGSSTSGQVYALTEAQDTIYAGTHGGNILAWKYTATASTAATGAPLTIQPVASLSGHKLGVVALTMGCQKQKLYSGSMDHTIRVWDLTTTTCLQTLTGHTSVVMSLTCYDRFLLSCSLDQTIKIWGATQSGDLEERYTRTEEQGLLGLLGVHDHQAKPILLCSINNDTVRLYDLPSFTERGILFTKAEVRTMQVCPEYRLFFTGDAAGEIKVWRWSTTDEEIPDAS